MLCKYSMSSHDFGIPDTYRKLEEKYRMNNYFSGLYNISYHEHRDVFCIYGFYRNNFYIL